MQTCDQWPEQLSFLPDLTDEDCGVKKHMTICFFNSIETPKNTLGRLFVHYSSLDQLELVVAWLLRFWSFLYAKCFNPESRPAGGHITAEERRVAMNAILRAVQKQSFPKVLSVIPERPQYDERSTITEDMLKRCKELKVLQRLTPFISHGFLRVEGRLRNSSLPFDAKYQFFSHIVIQLPTCSLFVITKGKATWVSITSWRKSISSIGLSTECQL